MRSFIFSSLILSLFMNVPVRGSDQLDSVTCDQVLSWCKSNPSLDIEHIYINDLTWMAEISLEDYNTCDITHVTNEALPHDQDNYPDPKKAFKSHLPLDGSFFYLYNNQTLLALVCFAKIDED